MSRLDFAGEFGCEQSRTMARRQLRRNASVLRGSDEMDGALIDLGHRNRRLHEDLERKRGR